MTKLAICILTRGYKNKYEYIDLIINKFKLFDDILKNLGFSDLYAFQDKLNPKNKKDKNKKNPREVETPEKREPEKRESKGSPERLSGRDSRLSQRTKYR